MNSLACLVFAALYIQSVYCSYYHGPTTKPVVLHNGYLADTHEVAEAKNAHLAALAKESNYGGHYSNGGDYGYSGSYGYDHGQESSSSYGGYREDYRYQGPTAKPVVLHNGYLADTHEVAASKNAHLAALAKESHYGYGGDYGYGGSYEYGHGQESSTSYEGHHGDFRYHGPTAIPHVLHDGHIADTHEVAAAKAEHFAAVTKVKAHGGYDAHSHHVVSYHGPIAKPMLLKSGYLADTHEVNAAKQTHLKALHEASGSHDQYYSHHN